MFAAAIAIPLSISMSVQGSSKLRAPTPVCAIRNMAEWNKLPDACSPINRPRVMAWQRMVTDTQVTCVPKVGWLCSQFDYFNEDAFNGRGCRGCISLAWNPVNTQGCAARLPLSTRALGNPQFGKVVGLL